MKILITGSSGFIGSKIVQKMKNFDHYIIEDDLENGFDILNFNEFKKVENFDLCIHLAANTFVPNSFKDPQSYFSLNVNGLINCLELCRLNNAKMIFPSTYVYGKPSYLPIDENHQTNGVNPYSESKLIGEKLCNVYKKYFDVEISVLRPSNIYGPNQDKRFLIPEILSQAKTGKLVLMDPKPRRDYLFIDDFVDCILELSDTDNFNAGIFNIGSGKSYSVNDVVKIVNKLYNNKLTVQYKNNVRHAEIMDNVLDISKIKSTINWSPKISLFDGLNQLIDR